MHVSGRGHFSDDIPVIAKSHTSSQCNSEGVTNVDPVYTGSDDRQSPVQSHPPQTSRVFF